MIGKFSRVVIWFVLLNLPLICAFGQSDFTKDQLWINTDPVSGASSDYIIEKNGEKVFGRIHRSFDFSDYDEIEFEKDGKSRTYSPEQIKGFGLDNGRYFLSTKLPETNESEFVQVLFSGRYQLLERRNTFYVDNGREIIELKVVQRKNQNGNETFLKLYISTLKFLFTGRCGLELAPKIERTRLEEQDLIEVFIQFHECEKLAYKVHVDKIPLVKMSPIIGVGAGMVSLKSQGSLEGRAAALQSPYFFQITGGVQLHDFRKAPRLSLDLKAGFRMLSSTLLVSQSNESILVTGSQEFTQQTFLFPLTLNYTFLKRDALDFYLGLGGAFSFHSLKSDEGLIDFTNLNAQETLLTQGNLWEVKEKVFSPIFKVGSTIRVGSKNSMYTEILGEYNKSSYLGYLLNQTGEEYDSFSFSFNLGIKF